MDKLVSLVILELVEGSSDWISPMSFVSKPDGDVSLVADQVHLNKCVKRPIHPFQCPKDILAQIDPKAKYFTVFDAKSSYWQIPLDQNSKQYTTFITEWGLYRYTRAPMGLASSGDEFCKRANQALACIPRLFKLVDDILLQGRTKKEIVERVEAVFHCCLENKITLSNSKYQVGQNVCGSCDH